MNRMSAIFLARHSFVLGIFLISLFCATAFAADSVGAFGASAGGLPINPAGQSAAKAFMDDGGGGSPQESAAIQDQLSKNGWRIRILDAAVTNNQMVTLGDIGQIYGNPPPGLWENLSQRPLWQAPTETGKPFQVNKNRLAQALRESLGEIANYCLLPTSMVLQSGGYVMREDEIRSLVVRELTPKLRAIPGEAELDDFRLPPYVFFAHPGQQLGLETGKINPGRLSLRFLVQELDGRTVRRFTGTVMINLWAQIPCAAVPMNRGDSVGPEKITWIRKNLSNLRGQVWDGRGGPWEAQRAISTGQPIMVSDLGSVTAIHRGAVINLVYSKGPVQVSVKAEAMADGGPGATIPVRNLQSKKQIYAEIINNDTVQVK